MHIDIEQCSSLHSHTSSHYYFRPHPILSGCIAHYTYMDEVKMGQDLNLTLVPDISGCIVLSEINQQLKCVYWGPTTTCDHVKTDTQHVSFKFFIEFLPSGAYRLLHTPQQHLLDIKTELYAVSPFLEKKITQAYEGSKRLSEFIRKIDALFLTQPLTDAGCAQLLQQSIIGLQTTMDDISCRSGYSKRHLQRIFQEQIGCTLKSYQRVHRINQAIYHLQNSQIAASEIALHCGYYDQSHFTHDFKEVCSITPMEYKRQMSDFYNESFKFHDTIQQKQKEATL